MMTDCDRQMRMATEDRQIRLAAEAIFNASINQSINSQISSYAPSVRTPDTVNEVLIAGSRQNGRMSNVRRFFCLFVTFDLLFTILMWLICIMISGSNVQTAFVQQIIHYQMKTSLFDIVMAAISRFTVLLLFYALLHIDHWCIVAISTSSTCVFLLSKVFLYDWSQSSQPVFQVLLVLTSFVLVWGEVWFLDIKVIPQETQANWYLGFANPERTPLLSPNVEAPDHSRENASHFYTPMDSTDHSDNEDQVDRKKGNFPSQLLTIAPKLPFDKIEECRRRCPSLLKNCYDLLISSDWEIEKVTPDGDIISTMISPRLAGNKAGKIFKITGIIDVSADKLLNHLFDNIENCTSWNKQVNEVKKIYVIDDNTDLVYQATTALGNGLIGSRDFVVLRHKGKYDSFFISSGESVNFNAIPDRKNFIRGENGVGCLATQDLPNGTTDRCTFIWILNTNLKGWLPKSIVNKSMSMGLMDFMSSLRPYAKTIKG